MTSVYLSIYPPLLNPEFV